MESALSQALRKIGQQEAALAPALWQKIAPPKQESILPPEGYVFLSGTKGKMRIPRDMLPKNPIIKIQKKNKGIAFAQRKQQEPLRLKQSPSPTPAGEIPKEMFGRTKKAQGLKPSKDVIQAIRQASERFNVPVDLLFDIAAQESVFDPLRRAKDYGFDGVTIDPKTGQPFPLSTASGLFQFVDGTWDTVLNYADTPGQGTYQQLPSRDVTDPYANAFAAAHLISNGQLGKWDASRDVWGPSYDKEKLRRFYDQTTDSFDAWR